MLKKLKQWLSEPEQLPVQSLSLEQAAAMLMFEVILVDQQIEDSELQQFERIMAQQFSSDALEVQELIVWAKQQKQHSTDLYQFIKTIRQHYSESQRMQMVQCLWQIAYADEHLDDHEVHIIRRINDLLHLHHSHFIQAKQAARQSI